METGFKESESGNMSKKLFFGMQHSLSRNIKDHTNLTAVLTLVRLVDTVDTSRVVNDLLRLQMETWEKIEKGTKTQKESQ